MAVGTRTTARTLYMQISSGVLKFQDPTTRQRAEGQNVDGYYQGHGLKWDPGNIASGGNIRGRWMLEIHLFDDGIKHGTPEVLQKIQTAIPSTASRMLAGGLKQLKKGQYCLLEVWQATRSKQSSLCSFKIHGTDGDLVKLPDAGMPKIPDNASPEVRQRMTEENDVLAKKWITEHPDFIDAETDDDAGTVVNDQGSPVPVSPHPVVHGFIFPEEKWPNDDSFRKPLRSFDKVAIPFRDLLDLKVSANDQRPLVAYLLDQYGHGRDVANLTELTLGEGILVGMFLSKATDSAIFEATRRAGSRSAQSGALDDQYGDQPRDEDITFD